MSFHMLPHLVPFVSLEGLEFQIHRLKQSSTDNSYYVEVYHPPCRLQGDKAFTFLVDLSRKTRKILQVRNVGFCPRFWEEHT